MKRKIAWVDAFTDKKFAGNPCAVVFPGDGMSEIEMQAFAKETNLSETAFVLESSRADFGARYFTPSEEIPLAGHPTLSTIHALIEDGQICLHGSSTKVTLELKAGVIEIEVRQSSDGGARRIIMNQKKPNFLTEHSCELVAGLFDLKKEDIVEGAPIQTVSTGTPQLMVPVKSKEVLRRASLDVARYSAYKARSDFFSPHLFCLEGVTSEGSTFARHFGVPPDSAEDAFTGSATGGMAAYLWRHGLIDQPKFIAEQGHWMGRPGQAWVEVVGDPQDIQTVRVGGGVVSVFQGLI